MNSISKTGRYSLDTPSQVIFNNKIFLAWSGQNTKLLKTMYSEDNGKTWSDFIETGQSSNVGPGLCVFRGKLYMAFADTSNNLKIVSSTDGKTWSAAAATGGHSKSGPAICSFNDKLYITWRNKDSDNVMVSSFDGTSWSSAIDTGRNTSWSPSICAFNDTLLITWTGINTNKVKIINSTNGTSWSDFIETGQTSSSNPSITMTNSLVMIGFKAQSSNDLLSITSTDGKKWTGNSKVGATSPHGPSIRFTEGEMYWAYITTDGTNEILFGSTGEIDMGTGKSVPLYMDSDGGKVNFLLYYDYQMSKPIQVHPDTGSFYFKMQALDLKIGIDPDLAVCTDTKSCNWSGITYSTDYLGSTLPLNANDLPPDTTNAICGWDCSVSGGGHSRLTRMTTLPAISLGQASNQFPNIPCGLMGYGYNQNASAPRNWSQLGMGFPGASEEAFFNQVDYTTFHIAINGTTYGNTTGDSAGYWGLNLNVGSAPVLLQNVPFYVMNAVPGTDPGTRQLRLGISADGTSQAALQFVNFDSGTPDSYRVKSGGTLCSQIAAYFRTLATAANDTTSLNFINDWETSKNTNLRVQTSLLKDSAGNYIALPFQFEKTPVTPLFTSKYYVKAEANGLTTLFFQTSNKNTFGLPFYKDRQWVSTDKPKDGTSFLTSIYSYQ